MASSTAEKKKNRPQSPLLIVLDDLDFSWTQKEVKQAILMWNSGYSIKDMAKKLKPWDSIRNGIDEVTLLIMHLSRQEQIKPRIVGVFGNGQKENGANSGGSCENIF